MILRLAYRIYASKFSVASITAFVASVSGAFVHQFKALPLRATVAAQTRRLGVDDEAAALRDIAFWNVVAAVLGFVALAIALSDAMDVVDAAGAKSGSGSGGKKKKDRSDKAGEGEKKGH